MTLPAPAEDPLDAARGMLVGLLLSAIFDVGLIGITLSLFG